MIGDASTVKLIWQREARRSCKRMHTGVLPAFAAFVVYIDLKMPFLR
jgi:hypothetical protein